jgi:hypothetical protein
MRTSRACVWAVLAVVVLATAASVDAQPASGRLTQRPTSSSAREEQAGGSGRMRMERNLGRGSGRRTGDSRFDQQRLLADLDMPMRAGPLLSNFNHLLFGGTQNPFRSLSVPSWPRCALHPTSVVQRARSPARQLRRSSPLHQPLIPPARA